MNTFRLAGRLLSSGNKKRPVRHGLALEERCPRKSAPTAGFTQLSDREMYRNEGRDERRVHELVWRNMKGVIGQRRRT